MKKSSSNWYTAIIYWLIGGLIIPMVIVYLVGVPLSLAIGDKAPAVYTFAIALIQMLSIWLGIIVSSKYLGKTHVIANSEKVAGLATIYLIIVGVLYRGYEYISNPGVDFARAVDWGAFAFIALLFYILSKKYLKNMPEMPVSVPPTPTI